MNNTSKEISNKEERFCPLCNKREYRNECAYGKAAWDKISIKDEEYSMVRSELENVIKSAKKLKNIVGKGEGNLEAWVQSKITKAADYIDTAADYLESGEHKFSESSEIKLVDKIIYEIKEKNKDPKGPVKSYKSPEELAKKHGVSVEEIKKQLEIGTKVELEHTTSKSSARITALQHLDEKPDYYTKLKKMETQKESNTVRDANGNVYAEFIDIIKSGSIEEENPGLWANIHNRRKKGLPKKKPGQKGYPKTLDIEEGIEQARDNVGAKKCWKNKKLGKPPTKIKDGKEVPNCIPSDGVKESSKYKEDYKMQEARNETPEERRSRLRASEITPAQRKSQELARKKAADLEHKANLALAGMKNTAKPGAVTAATKKSNAPEANRTLKTGKKVDTLAVKATKVLNKEELKIDEAVRLQAQTGNNIFVTLSWRGKYYSMQLFFPQSKLPSRLEISDEIQKIYPGSKVVTYRVADFKPGEPIVYAYKGGSAGKLGSNKNYVKPMGEEVEIAEEKKSEMPCNKPKAQAVGDSQTGKSHVVKACSDGQEKLIRFGQRGVKGSPKKEGESKAYASRRNRFQTRHAKNIAKGKMSAAYWANKVKW
jgi:hypothetical protein